MFHCRGGNELSADQLHLPSYPADSNAGHAPLFKVQLELSVPEILFRPSLDAGASDGFYDIIEGLVNKIYRVSSLVPRLADHCTFPHYQV